MSEQYSKNKNSRRHFLVQGVRVGILGLSAAPLLMGCNGEGEDKKVSPPEDLMQEHGLLNRILLIYDKCLTQVDSKVTPNLPAIYSAAGIIRTFVEDYHEKQEEDYLFPRFRKANQLTDLVETLLAQHKAGRAITDQLLQLSKGPLLDAVDTAKLAHLLSGFNIMYRPHEAREDTILFPAFRKLVSRHEYDSLGEEFEQKEHKKFGKDGFETMLAKVAAIEKELGIYDLNQFTPA